MRRAAPFSIVIVIEMAITTRSRSRGLDLSRERSGDHTDSAGETTIDAKRCDAAPATPDPDALA